MQRQRRQPELCFFYTRSLADDEFFWDFIQKKCFEHVNIFNAFFEVSLSKFPVCVRDVGLDTNAKLIGPLNGMF